jgi:hypothetical protein
VIGGNILTVTVQRRGTEIAVCSLGNKDAFENII